jgi:hypothetical protein
MSASAMRYYTPASCKRRSREERLLISAELVIGVTAVLGGMALVIRPSGSQLQAKLSALSGTPFSDWRVPGELLLILVGGGSLLTALWLWRLYWDTRELALLSGLGVVAFELVEWATIGFQPLEALVACVALTVVVLAWRLLSRVEVP